MWPRLRVLLKIAASLLAIAVAVHFLSGIGLQYPLPNAEWEYAGTTTLDNNGEATVEVPAYVRQRDNVFNYFVLGYEERMPYVRIKSQLDQNNRFSITGGIAGKVAAWEIIGHAIKSQ
jgi:hypothetical protein